MATAGVPFRTNNGQTTSTKSTGYASQCDRLDALTTNGRQPDI